MKLSSQALRCCGHLHLFCLALCPLRTWPRRPTCALVLCPLGKWWESPRRFLTGARAGHTGIGCLGCSLAP